MFLTQIFAFFFLGCKEFLKDECFSTFYCFNILPLRNFSPVTVSTLGRLLQLLGLKGHPEVHKVPCHPPTSMLWWVYQGMSCHSRCLLLPEQQAETIYNCLIDSNCLKQVKDEGAGQLLHLHSQPVSHPSWTGLQQQTASAQARHVYSSFAWSSQLVHSHSHDLELLICKRKSWQHVWEGILEMLLQYRKSSNRVINPPMLFSSNQLPELSKRKLCLLCPVAIYSNALYEDDWNLLCITVSISLLEEEALNGGGVPWSIL